MCALYPTCKWLEILLSEGVSLTCKEVS